MNLLKKLFIVFLLAFLLPNHTFAVEVSDELTVDGFRNMKFGDSFDLVKKKMKIVSYENDPKEKNPLLFYTMENDVKKFHGKKNLSIEYAYYEGRFIGVYIFTTDMKNQKAIEEYIIKKFGEHTYINFEDLTTKPKKHSKHQIFKHWNYDEFFIKTNLIFEVNKSNRGIPIPKIYYGMYFSRKPHTLSTIETEKEIAFVFLDE